MAEPLLRGPWVIGLTLLFALVLALVPLPAGSPEALNFLRPDWVGLALIYWAIAVPERFGVLAAFCLGLVTDLVLSSAFGFHSLGYVILAALAASTYQQVRMLEIWQQATLVTVGLLIVVLIQYAALTVILERQLSLLMFLKPLSSGLMWPWVFLLLRLCRRRYL
jgi:rod shape-determining protein MreD